MTKKEFLINEASKYLSKKLNVIAVDDQKKAIFAWKAFNDDLISVKHITEQINHDKAKGLAIITGAVSGNLEVIDFDLKNDLSGELMQSYRERIPAELLSKLRITKTRSGGFHFYYRCEVIDGNKKLASRPATDQEKKDTPHLKQVVLIETRGNGGYVVAPPSDGYTVEQDNDVPVLSLDERDCLLDAARSFNKMFTEERTRFTSTGTPFTISPFDDFNQKADPVALLVRNGWTIESENSVKVFLKRPGTTSAKNSGNFHKEKNLFYVWSTSTEFEPGKAYSPAAIYTHLNHRGDFSEASRQLIKDGYGTRRTPETFKAALAKPLEVDFKFWEVTEVKNRTVINVSLTKLVNFISVKGGFSGYKYNDASENVLVQVKDGFVKEVEIYDIKQFLKNEILSLPDTFDGITPDELLEVVYREYTAYLSKGFMDFLDVKHLEFLKDTKDKAFYPFRNGIVEVTTAGCNFHKYGEFDKVIWASQMIDAEITLTENPAQNLDFINIDYCTFLRKVCNDVQDKFEYFVSIIGYVLHKYKDPRKSFAIILAEESENEADGGGTGKGLFVKALKKLVPSEVFDGKQFNPGKSFAFQRVSLDTKLIAIEDAKRGFNFELMYSFITEGLPVEKKLQKEFFIGYEDSPKIIVTTNYTISDEGNHAKRRQKVLEFGNYFSPECTPYDLLGRMMFEDWDLEEYNRFYNFMFWCVQVYLEGGILTVGQSDTNKIKNIKLKYSEDLLMYFQNFVSEVQFDASPIKDMFADFLNKYGVASKDFDKRKFTAGFKYIAKTFNYEVIDGQKKIEGVNHKTLFVKPN